MDDRGPTNLFVDEPFSHHRSRNNQQARVFWVINYHYPLPCLLICKKRLSDCFLPIYMFFNVSQWISSVGLSEMRVDVPTKNHVFTFPMKMTINSSLSRFHYILLLWPVRVKKLRARKRGREQLDLDPHFCCIQVPTVRAARPARPLKPATGGRCRSRCRVLGAAWSNGMSNPYSRKN